VQQGVVVRIFVPFNIKERANLAEGYFPGRKLPLMEGEETFNTISENVKFRNIGKRGDTRIEQSGGNSSERAEGNLKRKKDSSQPIVAGA